MKNLKGEKRNYLTAVKFLESIPGKNYVKHYWSCRCVCGNLTRVSSSDFLYGKTVSCGCARNMPRKHGMSYTPLYFIFSMIKDRCNNSKSKFYHNYGGRGIKCLWQDFETFYADMNESYQRHLKTHGAKQTSLDRTNNNGDYCKENCQWVVRKAQNRNRRDNRLLTYKGQTKTCAEWAELLGIEYSTLRGRLNLLKWSPERALSTPIRKSGSR